MRYIRHHDILVTKANDISKGWFLTELDVKLDKIYLVFEYCHGDLFGLMLAQKRMESKAFKVEHIKMYLK